MMYMYMSISYVFLSLNLALPMRAHAQRESYDHILLINIAPGDSPVAYVAEELLSAPELPVTWRQTYGAEGMHHPYLYLLFLGFDNNGDLIPVRVLRDLYGQKRKDVGPPKEGGAPGAGPKGVGDAGDGGAN